MKVVAIIGQKGGSGKSTVALHLASCAEKAGISTAILDTDPQGSAHRWFERREVETPQVQREIDADALPKLAKIAATNGIDLLLIDTPGKAETTALAACELSDLVLIPVRPTQFDLETLGTVKRTVRIAERLDKSWVMLSQVPTNSRKVAAEGEEAISGYGMPLVPVRFHSRADYAYAMTDGLTAPEYDPTGKAAEEAVALFLWLSGELSLSEKKAELVG